MKGKYYVLAFAILAFFIGFVYIMSQPKMYPISWNSIARKKGSNNALSITELLGPKNSTIGKILPGLYKAKGTYKIQSVAEKNCELMFGFSGVSVKVLPKTIIKIPEGLQGTHNFDLEADITSYENNPNGLKNAYPVIRYDCPSSGGIYNTVKIIDKIVLK